MDEAVSGGTSVYKWIVHAETKRIRRTLRLLPPPVRAKVQSALTLGLIGEPFHVETPRGRLAFTLLGLSTAQRAIATLTKQPDTITWIDSFKPQSVFWDIGANVGVYSLYAAQRGDVSVTAFEPAAVNYFLLTANCELNGLEERIDCLLLGLGEEKTLGHMQISQFDPARSFSFKGKKRDPQPGRQAALIVTIDQLMDEYQLPCPNYIKIDVPHLAGAIVRGGMRTLQRPDVRELHIEASEDSPRDRQVIETLEQLGFAVTGRHTHFDTMDLTFSKRA
jgi:FkbM family methyltransferase